MIDGVHGHAADLGATSEPAVAAGLAQRNVLVLDIADLPDSGEARREHLAHFARGHAQQRVLAFLGHKLGVGSGRATELPAPTGVQLDVVQHRAHGNAGHGQRVAGLDIGLVAGLDHIALLHAEGREDIALFAVGIVQQRDPGRAVGIVFDMRHSGRNADLVALEVNDPVQPLHPAAAATAGDSAVVVPPRLFGETFRQGLLGRGSGDFLKIGHRLEATPRGGGFELAHSHDYTPSKNSIFSPGARVTYALRQPATWLALRFLSRSEGFFMTTFTPVTFTLNAASTAFLISILLASA